MTDTKWLGSTIRLCHKKARIIEAHDRAYTAKIELGGVHQHVSVAEEYAHEQLRA